MKLLKIKTVHMNVNISMKSKEVGHSSDKFHPHDIKYLDALWKTPDV